jgi:hypothetical protein
MSENENDFEALKRLLALKRHEIPPPGYFDSFSDHVIARIRAGETVEEMPWLLKFLQWFENRPAYPVGLASAMCLMLLIGIVSVQQNPGVASAFSQPSENNSAFAIPSASSSMSDSPALLAIATTNPPVGLPSTGTSIFNSQPNPDFQQVSFAPAGN